MIRIRKGFKNELNEVCVGLNGVNYAFGVYLQFFEIIITERSVFS